ncbi:MAG: AAA family ATPase [Candidatus Micrarchaeaceae archaeon]
MEIGRNEKNAAGDPYTLSSLKEIYGNSAAILQIRKYAEDVEKGVERKPLLLCGPSGTGKTAAAHLIAKEHSWNIVEMNAGDYRDAESINKIAATAASSRYLFGGKNMVLFDEIDELMPRFDTGAAAAIDRLVASSRSPIIFIADSQWSQSIRFLRGKVEAVVFRRLDNESVRMAVLQFARRANLHIEERVLDLIVAKAGGDARSAINDAWALADSEEADVEVLATRNRKEEIFGVLDKIFRSYTVSASLAAMMNTEEDQGTLISWIAENITKRYRQPSEISSALDSLSLATEYLERATRSQYYTYWRYVNVFISSGVALSKEQPPDMSARYTYPRQIKSLSESKEERSMKAKLAAKMIESMHSSSKRIISNELRILYAEVKKALQKGVSKEEISKFLESCFHFSDKEIEYIIEAS